MQNYLTDAAGLRWSLRRTGIDNPARVYALQCVGASSSPVLPGIVGFYAGSITEAKAKLAGKAS